MSEPTFVAIITALCASAPPTILALATFVMAIKNKSRQIEMHQENQMGIAQGKRSVDNLEQQINSNLQKYIDSAIQNALSEERLKVALAK
jgi:hypothetical protein